MDVTMRFRATSEEKRELEAGAKRAGLGFSEWARGVLLSASGDVAHVEGSPEPETVQDAVARSVFAGQDAAKAKLSERVLEPDVQAEIYKGRPPPSVDKTARSPKTRVLTREEREAKIAAAQNWLPKGGKK